MTATYIAIYLGFTFLIAGAAILAIQQLSEASDNIARYRLLRKLGAESKLIHHALFSQIAIYFLCPLGLAGFHSIFGMQLLHKILGALGTSSALPYVFATAAFVLVIYGLYFLATYFGCRSMICEKESGKSEFPPTPFLKIKSRTKRPHPEFPGAAFQLLNGFF